MKFRAAILLLAILSYFAMVSACGARSTLRVVGAPAEQGGSGGEGGIGVGAGAPECVVFNSSAALAPLDVFLMVDSSGSMDLDVEGGTISKWQAVQQSLGEFFYDEESAGIGFALSFFPIIDRTVPDLCAADSDCNTDPWGCRKVSVCSDDFTFCTEDSDCATGTCEQLGYCEALGPSASCFTSGLIECEQTSGPCVEYGYCEARYTCDVGPYEKPIIDVAPLPDSASPMVQTMSNYIPNGATPTLPALTGAVNNAIDWSAANPAHKVIVVLATDGLPTVCDPAIDTNDPDAAIKNLADAAAAGAEQEIQTFVIGVFSSEEQAEAQVNLDAIAQAGNTDNAFVVTADNTIGSQFTEALNQVRLTAKSCEFELAATEDPIDYSTVWVLVTPKQGSEGVWVAQVPSEESCDGGGFYFDVPPGGATPVSSVILCPDSCALLGASPDRTVEIYTTCDDPTGEGNNPPSP